MLKKTVIEPAQTKGVAVIVLLLKKHNSVFLLRKLPQAERRNLMNLVTHSTTGCLYRLSRFDRRHLHATPKQRLPADRN